MAGSRPADGSFGTRDYCRRSVLLYPTPLARSRGRGAQYRREQKEPGEFHSALRNEPGSPKSMSANVDSNSQCTSAADSRVTIGGQTMSHNTTPFSCPPSDRLRRELAIRGCLAHRVIIPQAFDIDAARLVAFDSCFHKGW